LRRDWLPRTNVSLSKALLLKHLRRALPEAINRQQLRNEDRFETGKGAPRLRRLTQPRFTASGSGFEG
jgi:hypothetical protein